MRAAKTKISKRRETKNQPHAKLTKKKQQQTTITTSTNSYIPLHTYCTLFHEGIWKIHNNVAQYSHNIGQLRFILSVLLRLTNIQSAILSHIWWKHKCSRSHAIFRRTLCLGPFAK